MVRGDVNKTVCGLIQANQRRPVLCSDYVQPCKIHCIKLDVKEASRLHDEWRVFIKHDPQEFITRFSAQRGRQVP